MSENCGACLEKLPPDYSTLPACAECECAYHFNKCSGVAETTWVKKGNAGRAAWVCRFCNEAKRGPRGSQSDANQVESTPIEKDSSNPNKRPRTSPQTPPHQIPQFQNADEKMDYLMDLSVTLLAKHNALLEKHNEVLDELRYLRADHTALQRSVDEYAVRVGVLEKKADADAATITELREENRLLQDYTRAENVVLHGVPTVGPKVDTANIVINVAKAANFVVTHPDISACHTLGTPKDGSCRIVCRFVNRRLRNQFLWAVNKAKLTTSDLNMPGEQRSIFVTDHLSHETAKLLFDAKRTLSVKFGGPFAQIWSKNRRIMIRPKEKETPFELKSYAHLRGLQNDQVQHMEGVQPSDNVSQTTMR